VMERGPRGHEIAEKLENGRAKIGIVCAYDMDQPGGVGGQVRGHQRFLKAMGNEVLMISPSDDGKYRREEEGITLGKARNFSMEGTVSRTAGFWPHWPITPYLIHRREQFDITDFHGEGSIPTMQMLLASPKSTANIVHFHVDQPKKRVHHAWKIVATILGSKMDGKIAVSETARDLASHFLSGEFRLIPNGVDIEQFGPDVHPKQESGEADFLDGKFNFFFVGRHEDRKGIKYLIQAFAKLRATVGGVRLIVGGDGKLRKSLEAMVNSEKIEDVVFVGQIPEAEKPAYYSLAAQTGVFCAPSYKGESFGVVLVEAMASGAAVIAGSNEGYKRVITDGEEGLVIDPRNIDQLSGAMARIYQDKELRMKMRAKGLVTAQQYDMRNVVNQAVEYYIEVASNLK